MTKNYYLYLSLIFCGVFASCDDDEPKEAIPPVVTIVSPTAVSKLDGTVTISASATDESGISSIKVFVDEVLLHENAEGTLSTDWNTETAADGAHIIKVLATDVIGNEGVAALTVEVFNDKKAPQLTMTAPVDQPFVKSTIKIDGSVVDETALESIKIFVDDVLLTTISNSNSFSFDWDTKTIADGNHTIKVSATDKKGNTASITKQVKVYNYFITINVVNPQVPSHVALWYLVSKYDGTLLGAKAYVAGESKIQFETPDNFNADDRYVFSIFQHTGKFEGNSIQTQYYAYAGYKPGESTISPRFLNSSSDLTQEVGSHSLTIDNVPSYEHIYSDGVNAWSGSVQSNALVLNLKLYNFNNNNLNPTFAILRGVDEAPRFKNFTGLQAGGTTQTSFDDFTPMVGKKLSAIPNATYTYNNVFGVSGGNYNESNRLWTYSPGFLQTTKAHYLYHPSGAYPEYIFMAQDGLANESHFFLHVGSEVPSSILRSDVVVTSFTKQDRMLSLQTTGTYDVANVLGSMQKLVSGENNLFSWSVEFPNGSSHTITLPQLPSQLTDYGFPDLTTVTFTNASFTDYSGFNGYEEYKNFPIAHPGVSIYSVSKNMVNKSITLPNPGGRISSDLFNQTLRIMMENNKVQGLSPNYFRK